MIRGDSLLFSGVEIQGFRGFREFTLRGLTRVNLFVGVNNAGKTSLLEAIELLSIGAPWGLWRSPMRREEEILPLQEEPPFGSSVTEVDLSHLFYGHTLHNAKFSLKGSDHPSRLVECSVGETSLEPSEIGGQTRLPLIESTRPTLTLNFKTSHSSPVVLALSPNGGVTRDMRRRLFPPSQEGVMPVLFLRPDSSDMGRIGYLWDRVVLTNEETHTIEALQIIEPRIERLGVVGDERGVRSRNVLLKLADSEQRLPLGSMGDGLKRLLSLSLHLASARGGCVLVDEIDTGLHFSVMGDMWKLVVETAHRLDVQVFATTHSLDCVRALAWIKDQLPKRSSDVTLHRIEKELPHNVHYTMEEVSTAARNHLEMR